jgi:membrane fusion protein (multidrug efflux system)
MIHLSRKTQRIAAALWVAVLAVSAVYLYGLRSEDTDNAYTSAHVALLSPKVSGLVTEVLVEENTKVKRDQVLVRIDPQDYKNATDNLRSQLGAAEASTALAQKDFRRAQSLFAQGVIPEQRRDAERTKLDELVKKRDSLRAQLAQAELNLAYTEIRAPADGTVGKKLVEAGMVVNPGQALLSFVDARAPWVVANFKETQLRKMKVGQEAEIEIDSIGGKTFRGTVESFAPGTGATFALIPPDNATGNFTKIVQRVPVRIRIDESDLKGFEDRIVPGLSVEAKVFLGEPAHAAAQPVNAGTQLTDAR